MSIFLVNLFYFHILSADILLFYIFTENTRAQLSADWKSLKTSCQSVEQKVNYERRQLLQGLDLSVAQTKDDINNAADKLVEQLTAAVRADQDSKLQQLGVLHETARVNIEGKFNKTKSLLNQPTKYLKSSERFLNQKKISETEIQNNRTEIQKLCKPLTDYLATPRLGGQGIKITFSKSVNATETISTSVGKINLTDEQTDVEIGAGLRDEQTAGLRDVRNPESDQLKLVKVIKTNSGFLDSIDVLYVHSDYCSKLLKPIYRMLQLRRRHAVL